MVFPYGPGELKDEIWIGHSARTMLSFNLLSASGPDRRPLDQTASQPVRQCGTDMQI